jgi:hypothetical protein
MLYLGDPISSFLFCTREYLKNNLDTVPYGAHQIMKEGDRVISALFPDAGEMDLKSAELYYFYWFKYFQDPQACVRYVRQSREIKFDSHWQGQIRKIVKHPILDWLNELLTSYELIRPTEETPKKIVILGASDGCLTIEDKFEELSPALDYMNEKSTAVGIDIWLFENLPWQPSLLRKVIEFAESTRKELDDDKSLRPDINTTEPKD